MSKKMFLLFISFSPLLLQNSLQSSVLSKTIILTIAGTVGYIHQDPLLKMVNEMKPNIETYFAGNTKCPMPKFLKMAAQGTQEALNGFLKDDSNSEDKK